MDINFIKHYRSVQLKMSEDDKISAHQISLYWALFTLWNECGFAKELSINRNDVMRLSKIGNANTYTNCLKSLDQLGYIKYNPSFNPLIGSKVTIIRCDKGSGKGGAKGSGTSGAKGSGTSGDKGSGEGGDTLYKLLNTKTIKLINDNYKIVNSKIESWINSETDSDLIRSIKEIEKDYLKNDRLIDAVLSARNCPFTDRLDLEKKLIEFCEHLRSIDETTKKEKDFKSHFLNWSRKKKEKSCAKKQKDYLQMEDLIIPSTNQNQLK